VSFDLNISLAVMRRENSSSATNDFVFACLPQLPAMHTEAASLLSVQHKGLSELELPVWLGGEDFFPFLTFLRPISGIRP